MQDAMRLLVVEDDSKIAAFVVKGLKEAGYAVDRCADGGVARGNYRCIEWHGCGHDAALGQRYRVAHMPTAAAAGKSGMTILGKRNGRTSN